MSGLEAGKELGTQTFVVKRADLVRYAGASGDFNPIHWSDRVAGSVGLPGVIAHGMLTMALAGRALTTWAGGVANIVEYGVRFTRPVPVPDDDNGTVLVVSGVVSQADPDGTVRIDLTAATDGEAVLGMARATVRPSG